ncbi:MAG: serine/threonine protein kinase [Myxococcales bacterium]|nr:serine/threonine protein kinase [Myxococcales bacterium]MCB9750311.1 serine/threonine protein kinase [Myxococcales bacterium]
MSFRLRFRRSDRRSQREPEPSELKQIERYHLITEIGRGSVGTVYAAHDPGLDRQIALKLVPREELPGPSDSGARRRRERGAETRAGAAELDARLVHEARVMARLSHPNIVPIYDVGTTDDVVYIAMELIDGRTLADWLEQTPRSWREVLGVYLQAGRGLAAAHAAGIIHRDFKPQNVLIGRDHRVRVLDFGLSRVAERPAGESAGDTVSGTPRYMAPEQLKGEPCDARADQFSYCVALYEALYRQRPFTGTTLFAIADQVLDGKLRPPPTDTRVPRWLFEHIRRGLSVEPDDRHPNLRSLLASIVFTTRVMYSY